MCCCLTWRHCGGVGNGGRTHHNHLGRFQNDALASASQAPCRTLSKTGDGAKEREKNEEFKRQGKALLIPFTWHHWDSIWKSCSNDGTDRRRFTLNVPQSKNTPQKYTTEIHHKWKSPLGDITGCTVYVLSSEEGCKNIEVEKPKVLKWGSSHGNYE